MAYQGVEAALVSDEMAKLFADIQTLLGMDLDYNELFYFAAQLHLRLAQIHPFVDGNGRIGRLVEKWFLAERLGEVAWYIQSERSYQRRILAYYKTINLGDVNHSLLKKHPSPSILSLL